MSASSYSLIRIEEQDGVPVIAVLCSDLHTDTVIAKLEEEIEDYLKTSGARQVVLDLSSIHFMSSSGLRVLILLRKYLKDQAGRFTMCGVRPYVAEVFRTTRVFTESFDFLPDVATAVAAVKATAAPSP
jgi:anti-anti-sigma factor